MDVRVCVFCEWEWTGSSFAVSRTRYTSINTRFTFE
jgi:hypothetical protein